MKKKKSTYRLLFLIGYIFIETTTFVFFQSNTFAQTSTIPISVKISICGDNIAEGPEDCDGTDIPTHKCSDLGYTGGRLTCDISCSYITTDCFTLIEEPPTQSEIDIDIDITKTNEFKYQKKTIPEINPIQTQKKDFLKVYDSNSNGIIESSEIPDLVLNWVNAWTYEHDNDYERNNTSLEICDLNKDKACNVVDFSVLMYMTNKIEYKNFLD